MDMKAFWLRLGALKCKMIVKQLNWPKDFLAVTTAFLTDLACLSFVSDLPCWESGS